MKMKLAGFVLFITSAMCALAQYPPYPPGTFYNKGLVSSDTGFFIPNCTGKLVNADGSGCSDISGEYLPLTGGTLTGPLIGPSVTASVNTQLNVMAPPYNAKGDCSTDDSAAIEAAITATPPGGSVLFPKPPGGCYLTAAAIIATSNIHLLGYSRDSTAIQFTGASGWEFSGNDVEVEGLTFQGSTSNYSIKVSGNGFRFHDNKLTGYGVSAVSSPFAAMWITANTSDTWIEDNVFTGNGNATAASFTLASDTLATGYVTRLHFLYNSVFGNLSTGGVYLFDCASCDVAHNNINQNNQNSGMGGSGYGLAIYAEGFGNITAISRASNVVTAVITGASWPFAVGQNVLVDAAAFGSAGTDFNGVFALTSVAGSTLQWSQVAANDTGTASGAIVPALEQNSVSSNDISNSAGACIYLQGLSGVVVSANNLSNCDIQIAAGSLPEGALSINGAHGSTFIGNSISGVAQGAGIAATNVYHTSVIGNVIVGAKTEGIWTGISAYLAVAGNTVSGTTSGPGIGATSTSAANCFKCSFTGNDVTASGANAAFSFPGTDSLIAITGGSAHAAQNGSANALISLGASTGSITVSGMSIDCDPASSTTATAAYGIRDNGTANVLRGNTINGCNLNSSAAGIYLTGTDSIAESNKIHGSYYGVLSTTGTRPLIFNNQVWGNTTAVFTTGATSPFLIGNQSSQTGPPPLAASGANSDITSLSALTTITVASGRRGTFTCTAGGTIPIPNINMTVGSDVTITMETPGGTITTSPAFKTITGGTGFSVLCGATDTSTYRYTIWN